MTEPLPVRIKVKKFLYLIARTPLTVPLSPHVTLSSVEPINMENGEVFGANHVNVNLPPTFKVRGSSTVDAVNEFGDKSFFCIAQPYVLNERC